MENSICFIVFFESFPKHCFAAIFNKEFWIPPLYIIKHSKYWFAAILNKMFCPSSLFLSIINCPKYCFMAILFKVFPPPLRHSLFHLLIMLILRVTEQEFFKDFCFVTSICCLFLITFYLWHIGNFCFKMLINCIKRHKSKKLQLKISPTMRLQLFRVNHEYLCQFLIYYSIIDDDSFEILMTSRLKICPWPLNLMKK